MTQDSRTYEHRIQQIERQVRIAKMAVLVSVLLALTGMGVGLTGMGVPERLQAKRIDVVNDQGQVLVSLQKGRYGGLILTQDHEGKTQCRLTANGRGDGTIATFSREKKTRVGAAFGG